MKQDGWTKTPNKIYEAMPGMCEAELRVTLVLVRMTYGFQRESTDLQYEDFMIHGGLKSKASIAKGIKLVLRRGFFVKGNGRSEYVIAGSKSSLSEPNDLQNGSLGELSHDLALPNGSLNEPLNSSLNEPFHIYKEKEKKEKERPARPTNSFWLIPEILKNDEFIKLWGLWLEHVDAARLTFTEPQAAVKLAELADAGPALAINSVKVSLFKGWKNIYITDEAINGRTSPAPAELSEAMTIPHTGKGW